MNLHITSYWAGVLSSPFIIAGGAFALHRAILFGRWLKLVAKGSPLTQWPYLWMVSYALPRLTKEFCRFEQRNGLTWFSPRLEKFRTLPRPKQED